jgi:hypothetical protein
MNWYYVEGGQQAGPVGDAQLDDLARQGRIAADTLVWREGMPNWQPLQSVRAGVAVAAPPVMADAGAAATVPRQPARVPFTTPAAPQVKCPKCQVALPETVLNRQGLTPCPACGAPLEVEVFPALFRRIAPGREGEAILVEGESSCFYHPQKKAVVPCQACGRFLCALCDCELKGKHFCPGCLESGQKKKSIRGLEDVRVLHSRQALLLAVLPFFLTGMAAIYVALRYRKEPGSIVAPMRWAFPTALVLGSLQTAVFLFFIVRALL